MNKRGKVCYGNDLAGYITETDDGYEFAYTSDYLRAGRAISLTLPLTQEIYKSKVLFAFFDGLIPEGWLLNIATDYWKIKANDRFELLLAACNDAIGAVSIASDDKS